MRPVLSSAEMRAADERAQASVGLETLIARAGFAVATGAIALLGGAYGRRVVVLAGRGHNGDDGRVAAAHLVRRGARVVELAPVAARDGPIAADLVVDAAFGTGFRGELEPPALAPGTPVLAVDLPSGLDADTGRSHGALCAAATVTFAALKPGLLLGDGPDLAGRIEVADIGLPTGEARQHLLDDEDLALVPTRAREAHKWQAAVYVVAGSPGMYGSAALVARAALRSGAGMVRLASPGVDPGTVEVLEAVQRALPGGDFAEALLADLGRVRVVVLGPGLGAGPETAGAVRAVLERVEIPVVLDADGLNALGGIDAAADLLTRRRGPLVMTPHEGEFARLNGAAVGEDRVAAVRDLARRAGAVVLLKGSTTIVAEPSGAVLFAAAGSARLATAGTGDVLAGVIGALIARGVPPFLAAGLGAHVHGRAGALVAGALVAGDLPERVGELLEAFAP